MSRLGLLFALVFEFAVLAVLMIVVTVVLLLFLFASAFECADTSRCSSRMRNSMSSLLLCFAVVVVVDLVLLPDDDAVRSSVDFTTAVASCVSSLPRAIAASTRAAYGIQNNRYIYFANTLFAYQFHFCHR